MNKIKLHENQRTDVITIDSKRLSRIYAKELARLTRELRETCCELHCAYAAFNAAVEEDLILSGIYKINMLRSRHTYLLRRIKQLYADPSCVKSAAFAPPSPSAQPASE